MSQTLDYQPQDPARRKWFSARNLALLGVGLASLLAAAWIVWGPVTKPAIVATAGSLITTTNDSGTIPINARPAWPWGDVTEMHRYYTDQFLHRNSARSPHDNWIRRSSLTDDEYGVGTIRLISLNHDHEPFMYDWTPGSGTSLKEAGHLSCDKFQADALAKLQKGDEVVDTGAKSNRRMVGALRAKESCIVCHVDAKVGTLLGALDYPLIAPAYNAYAQSSPDESALPSIHPVLPTDVQSR